MCDGGGEVGESLSGNGEVEERKPREGRSTDSVGVGEYLGVVDVWREYEGDHHVPRLKGVGDSRSGCGEVGAQTATWNDSRYRPPPTAQERMMR